MLTDMTSNLEIYSAANEMIQQFGHTADIEAAMRADKCLAVGDIEGKAVWNSIMKAVEEVLAIHPQENEVIH